MFYLHKADYSLSSLAQVAAKDTKAVDLVEISGGTYEKMEAPKGLGFKV